MILEVLKRFWRHRRVLVVLEILGEGHNIGVWRGFGGVRRVLGESEEFWRCWRGFGDVGEILEALERFWECWRGFGGI